MLIELEAGLAADGTIAGWNYDLYAAAYCTPVGPEPMDASDALAIAICHLHTSGTLQRQRAVAR